MRIKTERKEKIHSKITFFQVSPSHLYHFRKTCGVFNHYRNSFFLQGPMYLCQEFGYIDLLRDTRSLNVGYFNSLAVPHDHP